LQHQLYESLVSSVEVHGSTLNTTSDGSSLDSLSAGTTASVDYSKRLGNWGHLYLDNSSSYNLTHQQTSGSQLLIANEAYTVPSSGLVRLTQPRELFITSVTDANNIPLQLGLDYTVSQATDPWQLRIFSTGPSHIQPGSVILVTYTVQPNPTGSYSVFANQSQIRLSFWHEMAAVYVRYNFTDNQADSPGFLLQNDELFQAGAEFNWRRWKFNADYIDDHSTLYDYRSYNLAESYSLDAFDHSSFSIDLNQQWTVNYVNTGTGTRQSQNMTFYNFMFHYQWHPIASLSWTAEIGYRQQRGFGLDQDLFAARSYLNWMAGKLQIHLGYEHGFQDIKGETQERDFVFLKARRIF
jgi:hypothetical protein